MVNFGFDHTELDFSDSQFRECYCSVFYPDTKEVILSDMPNSRGRSVVTYCF